MKTKRNRKVDVDRLTVEQVDKISEVLGQKLGKICDRAAEEANNILKIYGLETRLQFVQPFPIGNPPIQE